MNKFVCAVAVISSICVFITSSILCFLYASTYWGSPLIAPPFVISLEDRIQTLEQNFEKLKDSECDGRITSVSKSQNLSSNI